MSQANSTDCEPINSAGFLQVLFLAGAIQLLFYQRYEYESMKPFGNPIFPCSCQLDEITDVMNGIHTMWVGSHVQLLNHVIPLFHKEVGQNSYVSLLKSMFFQLDRAYVIHAARNHVQCAPQTSTTVKLNCDRCVMNR